MSNQAKLYVGNLPYSFTTQDLQSLFAEFGQVVDVVVITDRASGRSRGFGFVEFSTLQDAQDAIAKMADHEVQGRKLVVNVARERTPRRNFRR